MLIIEALTHNLRKSAKHRRARDDDRQKTSSMKIHGDMTVYNTFGSSTE